MSGMTKTPLFSRISSAAAVVGPFAPSQMILALMWGAFLRRSEEHTSELQSRSDLVCRLLLEKKKELHSALPDFFDICQTALADAPPKILPLVGVLAGGLVVDKHALSAQHRCGSRTQTHIRVA